jgi:thiosulfate/3-mercaptopyruvate sulfurtransferase
MKRFKHPVALALAAVLLAGSAVAAHAGDMVVSPQWLAAHAADKDLVVLHIGDKGEYDRAHIPGARFVQLSDISVGRNGLSLEMPDAGDLKQRLQRLGISDTSRVVVYYGNDWVSPATRVVFTLYAAGLGDRVSLLDGGMPAWRRDLHAVTDKATAATTGTLSDLHLKPVIVDNAFVTAHAKAPGYVLIDARAPVFYDGVQAGGAMMHQRKGHIPGARSLPFTSLTNDDLTLKSTAELKAMFLAAGVGVGDHVIVYCHIGQQATAILFAAREAGIDAVLYDGSFEDWSIRDLPVETAKGK